MTGPLPPRIDGDAWTTCERGHRHWGRFGAAGLLLRAGDTVLLQHRADWTHQGGTWGIPGGARGSQEDAVAAAVREAAEETGVRGEDVRPVGLAFDEHGGWGYTTVVAESRDGRLATSPNRESAQLRWVPTAEVAALPLHPGFARAWARLRQPARPLALVVDAANVVGSRPDGWWRDRPGAARRLRARLARLREAGVPAPALRHAGVATGLDVVLPRLVLVLEGQASAVAGEPGEVPAVAGPGSGDDEVVRQTEAATRAGEQAVVVTADRELRDRVLRAGGHPVGPGTLEAWLGDVR